MSVLVQIKRVQTLASLSIDMADTPDNSYLTCGTKMGY